MIPIEIFGMSGGEAIIVWLVLAIIFIFEIVMFVHAILNGAISRTRKALWIIGMLLIHPIVAIAYYFTDYKKSA